MATRDISKLLFTTVYPLYVQKAERKGRTREEVDSIICWLTGYTRDQLALHTCVNIDFQTFFDKAPGIHPNSSQIKGVVCGVRVEDISDPTTRKIRYLDKLIDELAKGKTLDKIYANDHQAGVGQFGSRPAPPLQSDPTLHGLPLFPLVPLPRLRTAPRCRRGR